MSNIMKVRYIKKDDKYIVTSIDNILSADEIIERYGERVANIYLTSMYKVVKHKNHTISVRKMDTFVFPTSPMEDFETFEGVFVWPFILTKAQFSAFIQRFKIAGEALASAIKQAHEDDKYVDSLINKSSGNYKSIDI